MVRTLADHAHRKHAAYVFWDDVLQQERVTSKAIDNKQAKLHRLCPAV